MGFDPTHEAVEQEARVIRGEVETLPHPLTSEEQAEGHTIEGSLAVTPYMRSGGAVIGQDHEELTELFNLLQDNPAPWNRKLRCILFVLINHLIAEERLDGYVQTQGANG